MSTQIKHAIKCKNMVWFGLVLLHISHLGYLQSNPFLYIQTVLFQTIQFSLSTQLKCQKLFHSIQFSQQI